MEKKNFNEVLKIQELNEEKALHERQGEEGEMTLDDTQRVKVLSPGRLVFNRFIRNKLAIVGSAILIFMFLFAFAFPFFYPYRQTEIFYKFDKVVVDYAQASVRNEYSTIMFSDAELDRSIKNKLNANIQDMIKNEQNEMIITDDNGASYVIRNMGDSIYALYQDAREEICSMSGYASFATYNSVFKDLKYVGSETEDEGFASAVANAIKDKEETFAYGENTYRVITGKKNNYSVERRENTIVYAGTKMDAAFEEVMNASLEEGSFQYGNNSYVITADNDGYVVYKLGNQEQVAYLTTYVFDSYGDTSFLSDEFRVRAIEAASGNGNFKVADKEYKIVADDEEKLIFAADDMENPVAAFSNVAIRTYTGEDTLSLPYKEKLREVIDEMTEQGTLIATFEWAIPQLNENGSYEYDENGNIIEEVTEMKVTNKNGSYVVNCEEVNYLIDIYAKPSTGHWVGTDGDGMDVLARMMYGGRVSLMVCFVVIIIETILGVIMGGIAGYFGGWIDNLIMRLVDIFYCIPSLPILIILGALFDSMKMAPYQRLVWLMVVLGVLGWAGVARLVRGQILSLREQEFMVAAEAIGLKTNRRIFKHLVPNVMPQLIVTASSGLGSIIITESTLSFLGLGVKHPLATWGTMINSVTAATENMIKYTYIWVPVGLLICLTVVAFNFVGDGLRDAFDPKMKR